jgi:hypothetical protein
VYILVKGLNAYSGRARHGPAINKYPGSGSEKGSSIASRVHSGQRLNAETSKSNRRKDLCYLLS